MFVTLPELRHLMHRRRNRLASIAGESCFIIARPPSLLSMLKTQPMAFVESV